MRRVLAAIRQIYKNTCAVVFASIECYQKLFSFKSRTLIGKLLHKNTVFRRGVSNSRVLVISTTTMTFSNIVRCTVFPKPHVCVKKHSFVRHKAVVGTGV